MRTQKTQEEGTVLNSLDTYHALVSGRTGAPSRQLERNVCNTRKKEKEKLEIEIWTSFTERSAQKP